MIDYEIKQHLTIVRECLFNALPFVQAYPAGPEDAASKLEAEWGLKHSIKKLDNIIVDIVPLPIGDENGN